MKVFLIHIGIIMGLCNQLHLCGRLAGRFSLIHTSFMQKLYSLTLHANCSTKFFHACHSNRRHWLLPIFFFLYHFQRPWPWLRVTRSVQSKTCWLHLSAHFQLNRMEFGVEMKQFKKNILKLLSNEICRIMVTAVLQSEKQNKKKNMFACIWTFFNPFAAKLVPWNTTELYFESSLCYLDLGSRSQGCKKARGSALIVSKSYEWILEWIWHAVETLWSDKSHNYFL